MNWRSLIARTRALPSWLWSVSAVVALCGGLVAWHHNAIDNAVQQDRRLRELEALVTYRTLLDADRARTTHAITVATARADAAIARRDSAVRRSRVLDAALVSSTRHLRAALANIPDSTRALPHVATLMNACTAVANDCDALRVSVTRERAAVDTALASASRERSARIVDRTVADSTLAQAHRLLHAKDQRITTLDRRPSTRTAVGLALLSGVLGFVGGALR